MISLTIPGLILQSGGGKPENVRILGVLQRLALCYFFTALIVLVCDPTAHESQSSLWPIGKT
jgi:hypothetical protein